MTRKLLWFAGLMGGFMSAAHADTSAQKEKMASVEYLVGTWKCEHTVGKFYGTYTTTFVPVLGDLWLKQSYDFPASQRSGTVDPARQAECLMSWDPRRQYWVRFFAMSNGDWFAIRMNETGSGWNWKYVSFSKDRKPETPDADATFTKRSDSEYAIDGPTYPSDGARVTEHHVCKKL
jgi:hypothetical protein